MTKKVRAWCYFKSTKPWRKKYNKKWQKQKKRYYDKTVTGLYHFWTMQEIDLMLNFKGTDTQLSKILGRSVMAIQIKRCNINTEVKPKKDIARKLRAIDRIAYGKKGRGK